MNAFSGSDAAYTNESNSKGIPNRARICEGSRRSGFADCSLLDIWHVFGEGKSGFGKFKFQLRTWLIRWEHRAS